ncbi:MAG: SET domain-containing protein [Chitinophagia bacterium]
MILPILYIMETAHRGRGVFTTEAIPAGTIIEIAPVIVLNQADRKMVDTTLLHDYIFEWGIGEQEAALALGYVSMYNHHVDANCTYDMDFENKTIQIQTKRAIAVDEELCINYNGDGVTDKPVWFETK